MGTLELLLIAASLSADAFAVSVCHGIQAPKLTKKTCLLPPLLFGVFQALMPIFGYFIGATVHDYISPYHNFVACGLLCLLGAKMILESRKTKESAPLKDDLASLLMLAVATSIDALAVGISFSMMPNIAIFPTAIAIGFVTFSLTLIGVLVGKHVGNAFGSKAEVAGGLVLIIIGIRALF